MYGSLTPEITAWLLSGDVSLQYQVRLNLLGNDDSNLTELRNRIAGEGWGKAILDCQKSDGDWGMKYYQPKWTSTHYTLLDLMHLGIAPDTPGPRFAVDKVIKQYLGEDGGLYFLSLSDRTDDCVVAMFLQAAVYFNAEESALNRMADFLLGKVMDDGGWNCRLDWGGAVHSSVHTTISSLEALHLFRKSHPAYRWKEITEALDSGEEFLLEHQLCRSHQTGEVMDMRMLRFSWPTRWYFDVLRGLEYFARAGRLRDSRLSWAMEQLIGKRRKDGCWPVQNRHPGKTHIQMEKTGGASRWNTYRALKVLQSFSD